MDKLSFSRERSGGNGAPSGVITKISPDDKEEMRDVETEAKTTCSMHVLIFCHPPPTMGLNKVRHAETTLLYTKE